MIQDNLASKRPLLPTDPGYVDESWIGTSTPQNHQPNPRAVWLIPRMQELIAQNYPGTKLSISEWAGTNDGSVSDSDIVAGLIVVDTLGKNKSRSPFLPTHVCEMQEYTASTRLTVPHTGPRQTRRARKHWASGCTEGVFFPDLARVVTGFLMIALTQQLWNLLRRPERPSQPRHVPVCQLVWRLRRYLFHDEEVVRRRR